MSGSGVRSLIDARTGGTDQLYILSQFGSLLYRSVVMNSGNTLFSGSGTPNAGLISHSRVANNDHRVFRNGVQSGLTDSGVYANNLPVNNYFIGSNGGTGSFSFNEFATIIWALGMTPTETADLYTATQNFNSTLSRSV
jgi:hypothetical protein